VRVYSFETGGNGNHDMQSGLSASRPGTHATSNSTFLSAAKAKWTESTDYFLGTTVDQIAALRKELAGHPSSWHEADLQAIPANANLAGGEQEQKPGAPPQGSGPSATPGTQPPKP